ncbi:MAG: glycoside hydrolase family 172 protein [Phycisphaerae bacterium]
MRTWTGLAVLTVVGLGLALAGCAAPKVTTRSLLAEMTDLAALAEYPNPPFTCKQFSSYDRAAKSPEENWFANADAGNYLRVEEHDGRQEYVMMDAAGPGAIVRIWSANPEGTLRIYLDHAETPMIEAPMTDVLNGEFPGIPKPIAGERSRGWNSYFPIPYAEHCKVTSDAGNFYYHVNYRTYAAGAEAVSFDASDLELLAGEIAEAAELLASPREVDVEPAGTLREMLPDEAADQWHVIPSGECYEWATPWAGPGAIVGLRLKVDAADLNAALRHLLLTMDFDGEQTVVCPVGDFFGAAPGVNPYDSLPLGVTEDGEMLSHWVMPFRDAARIRIRNMGSQLAQLSFHVAGADYKWTDGTMHFHAKWRGEYDVPTRPMQDWNYVTATGKGVFVGVAFAIANPVKNWWGEGDEKIYVDGETFPSHFGTGTEDYYGYAWCCNVPFTHAYHNQPRCDGPGNYGHTAVNRWHIIDKIPFQKDFRFDMELWHWHPEAEVAMSVVSYWYARPGAGDGFPEIKPADLRVVEIPPYVVPRVAGALEGEEMAILEVTGGTHEIQPWGGLSNEKHCWWRHGDLGDKLVLGFEVERAGQYRVIARFLTAKDYGIHQLYVNDEKAGEPIDLFNPNVKPSEERELGTFNLPVGQNKLTVEIVSANDQAIKSHMFGLDYLRLARAP